MEETRLNLACGLDYKPGFTNIDDGSMFPDTKVDLAADIRTLRWPDDSVEQILVEHFAMYVRPEEMRRLVKRWRGWLKNGGQLEMETIDLNDVLTYRDIERLLIPLFGTEETGPHRWAWTMTSLSEVFEKAGFTDIIVTRGNKNPDRDFRIIATK